MTTRRTFLAGTAAAAATTALAACGTSTGSAGTAASQGPVKIRFAWWGNEVRNKLTNQVITDYTKANPTVTISPEPGEWSGYWDKLSTQYAGKDAPDIIQMDEQYLRDFGKRGALADMSKLGIDTSKFGKGLVESGTIDGKVLALCAGVNALSIVANPKVFAAAGVQIPDTKSWTWDQMMQLCSQITSKSAAGTYGINGGIFSDSTARAYLFQKGKSLFTETSLGWEPADMAGFFDLMMKFMAAKAIPAASENAEDVNKAMNQSMFGTGKTAMVLIWSNQVTAMQAAVGGNELQILRLPGLDGTSKGANLWYKSGQFQSINIQSKVQKEAGKFLDYYFNSMDAGKVLLAERGLPSNTTVLDGIQSLLPEADKKASAYLKSIEPDLRAAPVAPPPGVSTFQTMFNRAVQNVQFGKASPADAAKALYDEAKASIK